MGTADLLSLIRTGKDTGFGRFPSRVFAINAAWLELALTGIDLLSWTQHLLLDGELAAAEPKKLRYRLLHVPARITRSARRTQLRIAEAWPWAEQLVTAFGRLTTLPRPLTERPRLVLWGLRGRRFESGRPDRLTWGDEDLLR